MEPMVRIQAAAAQLGISIWSLRRYERMGVLPPARRLPGGHRVYSPEDLERIRDTITAQQRGE